jgi:hypothetical protein
MIDLVSMEVGHSGMGRGQLLTQVKVTHLHTSINLWFSAGYENCISHSTGSIKSPRARGRGEGSCLTANTFDPIHVYSQESTHPEGGAGSCPLIGRSAKTLIIISILETYQAYAASHVVPFPAS